MMHMNQKLCSRIMFMCIFLLIFVFPVTCRPVSAQSAANYVVTVNPTTPDSQMYTTVGTNWTFSFEALWSYGDNSGTAIGNATVLFQVNSSENEIIDIVSVNTTNGLFSFNYSSSTADILTITPIELVTSDGIEWNSEIVDAESSLYGLQSISVIVWWDTFHVSLVSYDTETSGNCMVTVNVTYLLLPQEGLTLPEWATYSNQTFLPKIAQNANVSINGVNAKETSTEGIFTANVSIWLPTSYIHVEVSQEGWNTTHTGFAFDHNANKPSWEYSVLIILALAVVLVLVLLRKPRNVLGSKKSFTILGGVLLVLLSIISLYWGLVGLDSTLHGFDWMILTTFGLLSFGFGLSAGLLSLKRKKQPFAIFIIIMPMVTNLIGVKYSLDMYGLTNPWLILIASLVLAFITAFLICNADEAFT